jgi:hypothetical protein
VACVFIDQSSFHFSSVVAKIHAANEAGDRSGAVHARMKTSNVQPAVRVEQKSKGGL